MNGAIRVFELDDWGYGPPAFDVANALYMVLFDAVVHSTLESYQTFRRSFVSGYVDLSRQALADHALDRLIDLRVEALQGWLADLETAPVGIRTASHEWLETLRSLGRHTARFQADSPSERPPPPTSTRRSGAVLDERIAIRREDALRWTG